ncbi:endoribonuclease MazF [Alcaligenaceae bacterium]|nr:endoribonuclease MazF [Alcaligenaceae bacterium]
MSKRYIPDAGDLIWLHYDLPAGSQALDYKPAVILSPLAYNKKSKLVVACAVTSTIKGYPFEVPLGHEQNIAALADQVKSLDWVNTKISYQGKINPAELAQIRAKLRALLLRHS